MTPRQFWADPSFGPDDVGMDAALSRACTRLGAEADAAIQAFLDESETHSIIGKRIRGEHWVTLYGASGKVASGYAKTETHARILCSQDLVRRPR